jgi:hypothetical protein
MRYGYEPRTPVELDGPLTPFAAPQPAPPVPTIPAALRPNEFDAPPGDEPEADDLPPRFAFAPPAPAAAEATPEDVEETESTAVENEEFSPLLAVGRPTPQRTPLVRIEEPVDDEAPIEPVVVFPGHGSRPFAAPAPEPEPAPPPPSQPGIRRFDAPPAQPAPAAGAARQDPEETERALRAALATLQRMSGAA